MFLDIIIKNLSHMIHWYIENEVIYKTSGTETH